MVEAVPVADLLGGGLAQSNRNVVSRIGDLKFVTPVDGWQEDGPESDARSLPLEYDGHMICRTFLLLFFCSAACAPSIQEHQEHTGAGLLNVTPPQPPQFAASYDFDLLSVVAGKACATRGASKVYWVGVDDLRKMSNDETTRQAIAAAAYDAISRLDDVDTIVITRVVADSQTADRVCATVYGRGIRLAKATGAPASGRP